MFLWDRVHKGSELPAGLQKSFIETALETKICQDEARRDSGVCNGLIHSGAFLLHSHVHRLSDSTHEAKGNDFASAARSWEGRWRGSPLRTSADGWAWELAAWNTASSRGLIMSEFCCMPNFWVDASISWVFNGRPFYNARKFLERKLLSPLIHGEVRSSGVSRLNARPTHHRHDIEDFDKVNI